jgi:hypothetical protein
MKRFLFLGGVLLQLIAAGALAEPVVYKLSTPGVV